MIKVIINNVKSKCDALNIEIFIPVSSYEWN
jgi:hypothetical protein